MNPGPTTPRMSPPIGPSTPRAPSMPSAPKTPAEEVDNFFNEFNLRALLPSEFAELKEEQQLKVVRDLKRRIVDIVKSDAQTQYSGESKARLVKDKGLFRLVGGLDEFIGKEAELKKTENAVFEKIKNTEEGKRLITEDLKLLTIRTQGQEIYLGRNTGKPRISYLHPRPLGLSEQDHEIFDSFENAAIVFTDMPYEWGQEKSGKHKKIYDSAKAEYDKARDGILRIKS